ncbi:hypothetical protein C8J38_11059 [Rhizobium sp. PP-WC-2G-219]|nr:hypothetical protein C8J38_11059 [Rhizobium sp. PP-WC-2G-219]
MRAVNIYATRTALTEWAGQGYVNEVDGVSLDPRVESFGANPRLAFDVQRLGSYLTTVYVYATTAARNADTARDVNVGSIVYGEPSGPLAFWSGSSWAADAFAVSDSLRNSIAATAYDLLTLDRRTVAIDSDFEQVPGGYALSFVGRSPSGELIELGGIEDDGTHRTARTEAVEGVIGSFTALQSLDQTPLVGRNASGLAISLADIVDRDRPYCNLHLLRRVRAGLTLAKLGDASTVRIGLIGDSWTYAGNYAVTFARTMQAEFGSAGPGWLDFRCDVGRVVATLPGYTSTFTGAWTYSPAAVYTAPTLGGSYSSTAGDKATFTGPDASLMSAVKLHYKPAAGAAVRYRWNAGSWTAQAVAGSGPLAVADMTGMPASGAWTLEIEIVSGEPYLFGIDGQDNAPGVRVHKLARDGVPANQWAAIDPTSLGIWADALELDAVVILLGTNDQPGNSPDQLGPDFTAIVNKFRVARPQIDVLAVAPPENLLGRSTAMQFFASAIREAAIGGDFGFLDLQPYWGRQPSDYAWGGNLPFMSSDNVHPSFPLGGAQVADTIKRALTASL